MLASIRPGSFVVATSLAMITLTGVSSAAAPVADQQSAHVSYRDLDLRSDQGVAHLRQRVRTALQTVCGQADGRDLNARAQVNRCRALAMTKAQDGVRLAIASARADTRLASSMTTPPIRVDAH